MTHRFGYVLMVVFIAIVIIVPSVVSADRKSDILQEIAQIFEQIKALQIQIDALGTNTNTTGTNTSPVTTTPTPTATSGSCPSISRMLGIGSEGADVSSLQRYLAADSSVYPEGIISGYYGSLTERAVQRWQAKYSIVSSGSPSSTGYGLVGPSTRGALKGCGNTVPSQFGGLLRVAPVSGLSPLNVTATATVNTTNSCERGVYEIDFGDGASRSQIVVPANTCREITKSIPHNFNSPGIYTVSLVVGSQRTSVPVTVIDGLELSSSAGVVTPSSGLAPLLIQAQATFTSQSCSASPRLFQTFRMDFGDGTSEDIYAHNASNVPSDCGRTITKSVPHTYTNNGTYRVKLEEIAPGPTDAPIVKSSKEVGTVVVGDVGVGVVIENLSIEPVSGREPLVVTAKFSHGLCREAESWRLDWGDGIRQEETLTRPSNSAVSCSAVSANRTFTHTYGQAGVYSIQLFKGGGEVNTAPLIATKAITVSK